MSGTAREGVVRDMADETYHSGPQLSQSSAKVLLKSPARYQWQRTHPRADKAAFDFGHAAHRFVLGTGSTIARVSAKDWRTNAAKAEAAEARKAGRVPLLVGDYLRGLEVAKAVKRHALAGPLFRGGEAEVSLYWTDAETGVQCRARLDYLRQLADGRWVIVDLKSAREEGAEPNAFGRAAASYCYDLQAAWYLAGAVATGLVDPEAAFVHVVVEVEPPHLITVGELGSEEMQRGHYLMRKALDLFRRCTIADHWPGYSDEVVEINFPPYAFKDIA